MKAASPDSTAEMSSGGFRRERSVKESAGIIGWIVSICVRGRLQYTVTLLEIQLQRGPLFLKRGVPCLRLMSLLSCLCTQDIRRSHKNETTMQLRKQMIVVGDRILLQLDDSTDKT